MIAGNTIPKVNDIHASLATRDTGSRMRGGRLRFGSGVVKRIGVDAGLQCARTSRRIRRLNLQLDFCVIERRAALKCADRLRNQGRTQRDGQRFAHVSAKKITVGVRFEHPARTATTTAACRLFAVTRKSTTSGGFRKASLPARFSQSLPSRPPLAGVAG